MLFVEEFRFRASLHPGLPLYEINILSWASKQLESDDFVCQLLPNHKS